MILLGSLPTVLVEGELVLAVLTGEHGIECLLEAFASFRLGPEHFVVIDYAVRIAPGLAAVADDMSGASCHSDKRGCRSAATSSPPAIFL